VNGGTRRDGVRPVSLERCAGAAGGNDAGPCGSPVTRDALSGNDAWGPVDDERIGMTERVAPVLQLIASQRHGFPVEAEYFSRCPTIT